ncbi:MAG: cell division protein ZapA [Pseudomonadota bacterium]
MGQVAVTIGGNNYTLNCRDGEEERLRRLAGYVDKKARDLNQTLGNLPESRMLLMSCMLIADELEEAREGHEDVGSAAGATQTGDEETLQFLKAASDRVARLTQTLQNQALEV